MMTARQLLSQLALLLHKDLLLIWRSKVWFILEILLGLLILPLILIIVSVRSLITLISIYSRYFREQEASYQMVWYLIPLG